MPSEPLGPQPWGHPVETEPPTRPVRLRSVHERRDRRAAEARERATSERTPWLLRATMLVGLVGAIVVSLVRSGASGPDHWWPFGSAPQAAAASSVGRGAASLGADAGVGRACTVRYAIEARSTSRYLVTVTLANAGTAPIADWQLRWSLPRGERVTRAWNAAVEVDGVGRTVAEDAGFDRRIAPGAAVRFGFTVGPSRPTVRSPFDLGGVRCR